MEDHDFGEILQSMSQCEGIQKLFIEGRKNKLSGKCFAQIVPMLKNKDHLRNLGMDLAANQIGNESLKQLVGYIGVLPSLASLALNVSSNKISSEGLADFSKGLKELKTLQNLIIFLDSNRFPNSGSIEMLIESIESLSSLKSIFLDLSSCQLDDKSGTAILEFIKRAGKDSQIKSVKIDISNNKISDDIEENIILQLSNYGYE